jgi:hypothetical protein
VSGGETSGRSALLGGGGAGDDAQRLEQMAIERGQQPSEVVSQLLRA